MKSKYSELFKQLQNEQGILNLDRQRDTDVLIVDGLNSFIRVFSAVPIVNDDGDHIGGTFGFIRSIGAIVRQFKPTRLVIVFDGKGGSARRKKMHSGYKEGRSLPTRFNRFEDTEQTVEQEIQSLQRQFGRLAEYLNCLPVTVISIDNIEADDVISYLATDIFVKEETKKVTIMSDDKDFLQLIDDRVQVWRPVEKKLYGRNEMVERFGMHPENFLLYKIFIGDNSDNIPGIKGVGPKTLLNKFPFVTEHRKVDIDEILQYCEANKDSKYAIYKSVLEQKDSMELNYRLMQLHNVDIAGSYKTMIVDMAGRASNTYDKNSFKQLFMLDKAYTVIPNVDSWLQNTFSNLAAY